MRILEYIPEPFTNALSWSILHSLWQIIVIAILWQISLLFARKAPAHVKQNLSIFAMLTIPVVFLITFFKQYQIYSKAQRIAFLEFEGAGSQSFDTMSSLFILPKESNIFSQFMDTYTPLIFWIYISGIIILSIYFLLLYNKFLVLKTKNLSLPPPEWNDTINRVREKSGIRKIVMVRLSSGVNVPLVAGFFKPIILFPLAISASLTMQEVENILLHEFYHIKCRDPYINALQFAIEIIFFYHPCTWWISRNLRVQREAKVDEWVVNQTNNPLNYAQTLLNLEEKRQKPLQPALSASSSKNTLLTRIKNIMHMKTRNFKTGQKLAAIAVIALATLSLAWINPPSFLAYNQVKMPSEIISQQLDETETTVNNEIILADTLPSEPNHIVLENGKTVHWNELSEEDKAEIREAMEEARIAIREAMEEVRAELNSEEMQEEIRQAREEIRQALAEVKAEMNNEEFRAEMQQAREEIRKAMLEMNKAMEDEEFNAEMEEVSKELQKVFEELNSTDWEEFGNNLDIILEEVGKSLEIVGPTLNEVFENLDLEELLKEIENNLEEIEEEQQ
jgi:beta-lactamase regulating signal transducer with metallopeptidase domain